MQTLNLTLEEKKLSFSAESDKILVVGDNDDYYMKFDLDEPRNAMFAVFSDSERQSEPVLLDENGRANIPLWVLKSGFKQVGLVSDGFASTPQEFYVIGSIVDENKPFEDDADPTAFEQLVALVNQLKEGKIPPEDITAAVREYVDENILISAPIRKVEVNENGELIVAVSSDSEGEIDFRLNENGEMIIEYGN